MILNKRVILIRISVFNDKPHKSHATVFPFHCLDRTITEPNSKPILESINQTPSIEVKVVEDMTNPLTEEPNSQLSQSFILPRTILSLPPPTSQLPLSLLLLLILLRLRLLSTTLAALLADHDRQLRVAVLVNPLVLDAAARASLATGLGFAAFVGAVVGGRHCECVWIWEVGLREG